MDPERLLSLEDARRKLGVAAHTICRWVLDERLVLVPTREAHTDRLKAMVTEESVANVVKVTCGWCGTVFKAQRLGRAVFCSKACRRSYGRPRRKAMGKPPARKEESRAAQATIGGKRLLSLREAQRKLGVADHTMCEWIQRERLTLVPTREPGTGKLRTMVTEDSVANAFHCVCGWCGHDFRSRHPDRAGFCSASCRMKFRYRRIKEEAAAKKPGRPAGKLTPKRIKTTAKAK